MNIFEDYIKQKLKTFPKPHQVFFSALTCEKLFPNYKAFSKEANWGNSDILEEIIVIQYQCIDKNFVNDLELKSLIESLEENTPDLDEHENKLKSYAFDCCLAFCDAIEHLITGSYEYGVNVALRARDTVDMFIQVKEDMDPSNPNLEEMILQDYFMKREINRQNTIINFLEREPIINQSFIKNLRDINTQMGPIIDLTLL